LPWNQWQLSPGMGGKGARLDFLPLVCPHCGADMRIVAFITEAAPVERLWRYAILLRFEVQGRPSLAHPRDGLDPLPDGDAMAPPEPAYPFDQRVAW